MNIVERASTDGTKVFYTLEWGRKPGERVSTGIYTYTRPKNKIQRDYNIQSLSNLETLKAQTLLDLQTRGTNFVSPAKLKENFLRFFEKYLEKNRSENNRSLPCCLAAFKKFVAIEQGKPVTETDTLFICALDITPTFCERFRKYLLDNLNGETPADYFMRFKKMISVAQESGYFRINPTEKLKCKAHPTGEKDTLEEEEYPALLDAPCSNQEVRKAAIASMFMGFRWCDVQPLEWWQIREKTIVLRRQTKTGVPLEIPLHAMVNDILGPRGKSHDRVFKLPSYDTCLDILQNWVDAAGIDKHITWHCLRHGVSDILLEAGMDVHTVAAYLGQTTAKQILERYKKRVRKHNLQAASSKLPVYSRSA